MMLPLLSALVVAATLPVLPLKEAPKLVSEAAGSDARPVVLHFWATWCTACREEFPSLREELLQLPGRGVGVLLVSIDPPQDRAKAEQMLAQYKLEALPAVLLNAPDPEPVMRAVGERKWDGTLPATFVFDGAGKLRRSFIGRAKPSALEAAVRALKR
jgi:cytochrome c biogenesis protein CcmG/thiol:disulfide interchange protein DsbE